jgi:hypothetical protein
MFSDYEPDKLPTTKFYQITKLVIFLISKKHKHF